MSEPNFPFEGSTMTAEAPPLAFEEPGPEPGNRTKLVALIGLAAVLVLGAMAYFLLFAGGGGEDSEPPATPPKAVAPVEQPEEPAAEPAKKSTKLKESSFGRDPFEARIVEAPASSTVDTATTGDATSGTTESSSTTSGDTSGTTSTTSAPSASEAHSFRVLDVAPDNNTVTVKVDGKTYRNLKAGEVFATYFKVVLISGSVNSFQYGDDKFNVVGTKRLTIA
jgi:cytoskeletal protein RodZ